MTITIPPMSPFPGRGAAPEDYIAQADTAMQQLPGVIAKMNELGAAFNVTAGLGSLGYQPPVLYAAGLSMTVATQTVQYGPSTYAPLLGELPFTTSGAFETTKFRLIQGVAGVDLAARTGGRLVGVVERSTGAELRLDDTMARMPSRFGRIDASSFPRLFDALRRYRLGDPTQPPIVLGIYATSLGNGPTLPNPSTQSPGMDFVARLRAELDPAGLIRFDVHNYSIDGSTVTDWPAAIAAMTAAGVVPHLCYLIPGMNDFATAQYNGGQGFDGFQRILPVVLYALKKIGADIVCTTSVHPSVVNYPSLQSMPAGMAQVYPTAIAAPVSDAALQPSAANGLMSLDVLKNGHPITVSVRYFDGNQAIRSICAQMNVAVIDAQQYQFEQYAAQLLQLGSMQAVETANFDAGQINHPNLLGITPYHRGNADFCAQMGQQGAQAGHAPQFNGLFGMNLPRNVGVVFGPGLPSAVWDIYPQHGDVATPPLSIKANMGPLDGYGVKSPIEAWHIDPTNGSLVSAVSIIGALPGMPAIRAMDYTGRIEVRDRLSFYNLPVGSTVATYTLPDNMGGSLRIFATHPGVTLSQRYRAEFSVHGGVITQEPGSPYQIGAATEFTVAISGRTITTTIINAGTNIHIACDAW